MSTRWRFRLAHLLIPLALLGLLAASFLFAPAWPDHSKTAAESIDPADYGHVQAYDGYVIVTLAPNIDQRRKYEVGFGRIVISPPAVYVSDDGRKYTPLPNAEPMGGCGFHSWGLGVNVIVAVRKCVPSWATITGDPANGHAQQWIRVENLMPGARRVMLKYQ